MTHYSVQAEAKRILEALVGDDRLGFTPDVIATAKLVKFSGGETPFLPTPFKMGETAAALAALVGTYGSIIANERYAIEQSVSVDTDKATLYLMGLFLANIDGVPAYLSPHIIAKSREYDRHQMMEPFHFQLSNQYQCKDGRYYHTHVSLNPGPMLRLMNVKSRQMTLEEARTFWKEKVGDWDSQELDIAANEVYQQAGAICYRNSEFLALPHGLAMSKQPLVNITTLKGPRKDWPVASNNSEYRPLTGIKVIDLSRAVAAPAISKLLALLGAEVIRVSCQTHADVALMMVDLNAGKRDVCIDLKTEDGRRVFESIVKDADVLIDCFRPNAIAKLGFNSSTLREISPSLIYVRENCYGWHGPWAHRSGWQQIADAVVGLAIEQGAFLGLRNEPVMPLLPNSDYQTGLVGAAFVLQSLQKRTKENVTFDIDVSLVQYNIWLYQLGLHDDETSDLIRSRHPHFKATHDTEILDMWAKLRTSIIADQPDLLFNPEYFIRISGREWGESKDITLVGPPFNLSKSRVDYLCPSGRRGWANSNPTWLSE